MRTIIINEVPIIGLKDNKRSVVTTSGKVLPIWDFLINQQKLIIQFFDVNFHQFTKKN